MLIRARLVSPLATAREPHERHRSPCSVSVLPTWPAPIPPAPCASSTRGLLHKKQQRRCPSVIETSPLPQVLPRQERVSQFWSGKHTHQGRNLDACRPALGGSISGQFSHLLAALVELPRSLVDPSFNLFRFPAGSSGRNFSPRCSIGTRPAYAAFPRAAAHPSRLCP
jgi:hypothetical protein